MDARIEVMVGRIERLAVDAVVNAANARLLPGAGVDGALRAAAGPDLTRLTDTMAPLGPGQAAITPGFNGPFNHIIHVAAPVWRTAGDKQEKEIELGRSYVSAITLAEAHGLASIAFPCIGTGIYGWPADIACRVALTHIEAGLLSAPGVQRVVMCCFSEADADVYRAGLRGELR